VVSVLCIVLGVAGANASRTAVLVAGFAGLVAGAISMAAGEWISVTSQVELFNGVLSDVKSLVSTDRTLLIDQLEADFNKSGISSKTATAAAKEISRSNEHLYNEFVSNVTEINPKELGSLWTAAFSSFFLFTAGAIAITLSIALTALGGLAVGSRVACSSGNSIIKSALRQVLIIILPAAITYGIGHLFGTAIQ
jgi:VIT1/CCC1 family predicted Fe2+/Mn2+ transporter